MKDEIKEILDYLTRFNDEDKYSYSPEYLLGTEEIWLLYDYITNLQEENKRLNNIINKALKELEKIGDFYITPTGEVIHLQDKISHINKAIDKLKELKEGK